MSDWISVKDRLPKKLEDVLVFTERGLIDIRRLEDEEYPECEEPYERYVWNDQGIVNDITHWMRLPEPPK